MPHPLVASKFAGSRRIVWKRGIYRWQDGPEASTELGSDLEPAADHVAQVMGTISPDDAALIDEVSSLTYAMSAVYVGQLGPDLDIDGALARQGFPALARELQARITWVMEMSAARRGQDTAQVLEDCLNVLAADDSSVLLDSDLGDLRPLVADLLRRGTPAPINDPALLRGIVAHLLVMEVRAMYEAVIGAPDTGLSSGALPPPDEGLSGVAD